MIVPRSHVLGWWTTEREKEGKRAANSCISQHNDTDNGYMFTASPALDLLSRPSTRPRHPEPLAQNLANPFDSGDVESEM